MHVEGCRQWAAREAKAPGYTSSLPLVKQRPFTGGKFEAFKLSQKLTAIYYSVKKKKAAGDSKAFDLFMIQGNQRTTEHRECSQQESSNKSLTQNYLIFKSIMRWLSSRILKNKRQLNIFYFENTGLRISLQNVLIWAGLSKLDLTYSTFCIVIFFG